MSPTTTPVNDTENKTETQAFALRYQQPSQFHADHLQLWTNLERPPVRLQASMHKPLAFRDAMATLFALVSSDYRYVPKDKAAYLAFMQMRRSSQNQGLRRAYRDYYQWLLRNDPLAWMILDPIVSVHADGVSFEVFSKDEGCYAALTLDNSSFTPEGEVVYGSTNIDFSSDLLQGIEQIRSHRATYLAIGSEQVQLQTETAAALDEVDVIEKRINVPLSWLRGLLQVQSATQLPSTSFTIKPIDLYNALRYLRLHADIKGKRRGLRVELQPQQAPRLVLEPFDEVISTSAELYQGKHAQVIRLWGRRRLLLLQRFLPYAEQIEVRVLGNGLPSFWTLKGLGMTLTVALTGFTASNWAQALNFDLLLPRRSDSVAELKTVVDALQQQQASLAQLVQQTGLSASICRAALQQASQQGLVRYDLAYDVYRYRPLTEVALPLSHFQFRHDAEKLAYDLVARQKAIGPLQIKLIPLEGVEISAEIQVKEDKREYLAQLKLGEEGQISKAACSCPPILQHGLTQGPCSHLIALRIAYAEQQAKRDLSQLTQETRLLTRRRAEQAETIQITLNNKRLLINRERNQRQKQQQFAFNSIAEARHAYVSQLAQLEKSGFIEG